jgi:hypothetical protein
MKTALQELIERLQEEERQFKKDKDVDSLIRAAFQVSIQHATELLEKEREQIENAWLDGVSAWDSEMEAEQYYNETFNQNK